MNVEVMLSVMNLKKEDLGKMNITSKCTIINQCGKEGFEKYKNFNIYSYNEKGLSRSRNRGLENVKEDIILICDDDVVYDEDYEKKIIKEFENHPQADLIFFNMQSPYRKKKTIKKRKRLHIYNSLHYASCNIAFRKESIDNKDIKFNTNFGPNAKWGNGSDTIFIRDVLNNKLKIYSSPVNLGTVYHRSSTWFNGYNEKFFFNKGVLFTAINTKFRIIFILQFLLRHREFWKDMGFMNALKCMLKGSKDYLEAGNGYIEI